LQDGGENELAEGAAGIDHPRGSSPGFHRQALGSGTDEHGKAAGSGAHGREQAQGNDQAEARTHEGRDGAAEGQHQQARNKYRPGAITVRHRPRHRLNGAPGELPHGERQADGGDTQAGMGVEGADKEPEGLPGPHGDHENAGGGQSGDQNVWPAEGAKHGEGSPAPRLGARVTMLAL